MEGTAGDTATGASAPASAAPPPATSQPGSTGTPAPAPPPERATTFAEALRAPVDPSDRAEDGLPLLGPVPLDRHKAILEKARTDARAALLKDYPGLGDQITPELFNNLSALRQRLQQQGPIGFVNDIVAEMAQSPQHADQLRAWAMQTFAPWFAGGPPADRGGNGAAPPPEDDAIPLPDSPEGYTVNGLGQLMQWFDRRIDSRIGPVRAETDAIRQQREMAARRATDERFATGLFGQLQRLPHFEQVKPELAKRFMQQQWKADTPHATIEAALYRLYTEVLGETVLPGLTANAQRDLKARLDTKARATTTSPTTTGASAPVQNGKALSFRDALREELAR